MIRSDIIIEDTTLRDGEQAPGLAFTQAQKIEIHDALVDLGVRWIEVGIPAMGGTELETLKALLARGGEAHLVAWNRGNAADVSASLRLGFRAVHIGLPTSPEHLAGGLGRDIAWLFRTAADLVKAAKDKGAFVSISAEDVGRTEISLLRDYAQCVYEAGADRLRLSDTIGILTPQAYAERVRAARASAPIDIQCHAHNDFGLAVANTLAGLEAGARYFHVTVNGIGERAGMPDIAQMAMALKQLHGIDLGLKLDRLWSLARLVARATHQPVAPWQPVVGDNVFSHESGIHVRGTLRDERAFEPFPPETVGGTRRIVIGKHSGRTGIRHVLSQLGATPSDDELTKCLQCVRERAMTLGRALETSEVMDIYCENRVKP